jgi:hypothetical protein
VDDALTAEGGGLEEEPDALLSVRAAVRAGAAAGRGASFGVRAAAVDVEAAAVVAGEGSGAKALLLPVLVGENSAGQEESNCSLGRRTAVGTEALRPDVTSTSELPRCFFLLSSLKALFLQAWS